jgi:hypothetical protein
MALESEFIEAVDAKNKRLVRIKLGNIITIDPTLKTFREMREYAESNIPDLFDVHTGVLKSSKEDWTKNYYNDQQTELSYNFSRERLQHLCDIAVYLYGDRINTINDNRTKENSGNTAKVAGGVALGGGVVLAGIGAIAEVPVVLGIGIAAAVIGAVVLITESQKK